MSSGNKFHLNGSTVLSLNERFTRMQGRGGIQMAIRRVEPSHSHSRFRARHRVGPQLEHTPRKYIRNKSLLAQLEQKHILHAALKLKQKSLKVRSRNILGAIGDRQMNPPSARASAVQSKRRRNSRPSNVAEQIATIKADLLKNIRRVRQLSRSNSKLNLNEPLNVRGRPRLKRNNNVNARIAPRRRSRSRSRMGQYGTNAKRNSQERSVSRQRSAATVKFRRSNSRVHGNSQSSEGNIARPKSRQRKSVNNRTQIKRQNNKNTNMKGNKHISNIKRGRIIKNFRQNQRKAIRSQPRRQPAKQQNRQKQNEKRESRGKRTSGQTKKQSGKRSPVKSKEQLDAELDQYMVNTMPTQDQNIGLYTK